MAQLIIVSTVGLRDRYKLRQGILKSGILRSSSTAGLRDRYKSRQGILKSSRVFWSLVPLWDYGTGINPGRVFWSLVPLWDYGTGINPGRVFWSLVPLWDYGTAVQLIIVSTAGLRDRHKSSLVNWPGILKSSRFLFWDTPATTIRHAARLCCLLWGVLAVRRESTARAMQNLKL